MTFVLPLYGGSATYERPSYSLDNIDDLIDHIDNNHQVQELLEIEDQLGHGVYQTVDRNYIIVSDVELEWADVLGKPALDAHLQWNSFQWTPKKEDWAKMHKAIATHLAGILAGVGVSVDPSRIRYSVRRKHSRSKVYRAVIL